jgi:high affinity Mn2+ porin
MDKSRPRRSIRVRLLVLSALLTLTPGALAEDLVASNQAENPPARLRSATENWNLHAQSTLVVQADPPFHAAYSGANSLRHRGEVKETVSADLMGGMRLWRGGEFYVDGLAWQGFGLSDTVGIAGFPSGEAFRIGTNEPNATFARVFLRQTFGLGGEAEAVKDDALRLGSDVDVSRVTVTIGEMSAKDIFDGNAYADDSRTQFMNWALTANGAWDYPADTLGFIPGAAIELNEPKWAMRYGFFAVSRVQNGLAVDWSIAQHWGMIGELEHRHSIRYRTGSMRLLGWTNHAHMRRYEDTSNNPALLADSTLPHPVTYKFGFGMSADQELTEDLGAFLRLGWNDGRSETWMFTDIDRTVTAGLSLLGARWDRPEDTLGIAGALNGISPAHRNFLAAGGLGITAGDGKLNYSLEEISETYYSMNIVRGIFATLDYQFVSHPAYNRDRGPVHLGGFRLHAEF